MRGRPTSLVLDVREVLPGENPLKVAPKELGTAWLIDGDVVVTAFHVVGYRGDGIADSDWRDRSKPNIRYYLSHPTAPGAPVQVHGLSFDEANDVALLSIAAQPEWKPWALRAAGFERADESVEPGSKWSARGFPNVGRAGFTLDGQVTAVVGTQIQLYVNQGTVRDWGGMSGAPVQMGDWVIGLISSDITTGGTILVTPVEAVEQLLEQHLLNQRGKEPQPPRYDRFPVTVTELAKVALFQPRLWSDAILETHRYLQVPFAVADLGKRQQNDERLKRLLFRSMGRLSAIFVTICIATVLAELALPPHRPRVEQLAMAVSASVAVGMGISLAVCVASGIAAGIIGCAFGCLAAILCEWLGNPIDYSAAVAAGAALGAGLSVFSRLVQAGLAVSTKGISSLKISGWGIAYLALGVLALLVLSRPVPPDAARLPVSALYCAGYGVLLAAPTALACWYRVRKRALLPRPYTGLAFAGNLLAICASLGAIIGFGAEPGQCKQIACFSGMGLAVGALWGGLFDVAATWFRNQWRSPLKVHLLCGCVLAIALVSSGPLRWGGFSMVSAFLLTGMVQLVKRLRGIAMEAF